MKINQKEKDMRREKILDVAFRLFVDQKIESVTMGEIAKEAGIGRATLFRYFPGKLELVIAVNTKKWKDYLDELDDRRPISSIGDIPAIGRLTFTLDSYIDMYQNNKDLLRYNDNFNHYVSHSGRKDLKMDEFNKALIETIDAYQLDLIVLAGFLVVLPAELIAKYRNKIINIHPSLIPSFCGNGFYGLHVHEKALERGVKVTGATVHFVDEGTDTGPIIYQKAVDVLPGDTPEILQKRVMEQAEWKILPQAIDAIANDKL